ncbi:hypothetical protein AV530_010743 [Patagioenas fasciata monilis]|uniref:Secreted protein n=1 Tax=Patagioenas fasciata monilis TaxID=372326 RepID=A0A1V4K7L1_PATFA|nr:hypothetical protein AV530_010743 [Patagioenas fasciata monilis]
MPARGALWRWWTWRLAFTWWVTHARRKVDLGDKGRVWMVRGMNPSLQQCQKPQEKTGTQRCCTFAGLGSAERSRRAAALTGAKEMVPVSKLAISIGKTDKK